MDVERTHISPAILVRWIRKLLFNVLNCYLFISVVASVINLNAIRDFVL